MNLLDIITFKEIINRDNKKTIAIRLDKQGYYDIGSVEKNFKKVLNLLGEFNSKDHCALLSLRLKNKVAVKKVVDGVETTEYITPDYPIAKSVAKAISIKLTRKLWGRKGKYDKIPMGFTIESSKKWDKDHIHGLIRFAKLKQYYSENELSMLLRSICNDLNEVNSKDHTAVDIRMFHYCENEANLLGSYIEYICKTSANFKDHSYDPLLKL